jgi:hypothetical protein
MLYLHNNGGALNDSFQDFIYQEQEGCGLGSSEVVVVAVYGGGTSRLVVLVYGLSKGVAALCKVSTCSTRKFSSTCTQTIQRLISQPPHSNVRTVVIDPQKTDVCLEANSCRFFRQVSRNRCELERGRF